MGMADASKIGIENDTSSAVTFRYVNTRSCEQLLYHEQQALFTRLGRITRARDFRGQPGTAHGISFVRQNDNSEVIIRTPEQEPDTLDELMHMSARFKTKFSVEDDQVVFTHCA